MQAREPATVAYEPLGQACMGVAWQEVVERAELAALQWGSCSKRCSQVHRRPRVLPNGPLQWQLAWHSCCPVASWYEPAGQARQVERPPMPEKVPAGLQRARGNKKGHCRDVQHMWNARMPRELSYPRCCCCAAEPTPHSHQSEQVAEPAVAALPAAQVWGAASAPAQEEPGRPAAGGWQGGNASVAAQQYQLGQT